MGKAVHIGFVIMMLKRVCYAKDGFDRSLYNKIYILLIEDTQKNCLESEKHYILDQEDCLIEL